MRILMRQKGLTVGLAACGLIIGSAASQAASSLSNALTGFTGNSSQAATQTALAAAGFNVTDPTASEPITLSDPSITFNSSGALFGNNAGGDDGRNYIRTTATDYANVSFVANVTWVTTDIGSQSSYFGMGSGELGQFRIADWATPNSAVVLFQEIDLSNPTVFNLTNANGSTVFDAGTAAPTLDTGTNRLQLTYDWFAKTATFAIDTNYAGGPFVADVTLPPIHTLPFYGGSGWSGEPSRLFFGGDDGTTYKDFQVTVSTPNMVLGDLNGDGNITAADWVILRTNQQTDLSGKTLSQAYVLGDLTGDKANNHADFVLFKSLYESANGPGSFAAIAGVPEPATVLLALVSGALILSARRRAATAR